MLLLKASALQMQTDRAPRNKEHRNSKYHKDICRDRYTGGREEESNDDNNSNAVSLCRKK